MCAAAEPIIAIRNWNTLRQVAVLGYQDAVLCMAMVETVRRSNEHACIAAINNASADLAARLVIDGLLFRLHIFVVRAFARVGRKDDRHLRAAIEFLNRKRLDDLLPPQDANRLKWAASAFESVDTDGRLARLKKMRDKQLAHIAAYDATNGPTFDDLYGMAKLASDIWENLAIGSAAILVELDFHIEDYQRSADIFWSRWDGVRNIPDAEADMVDTYEIGEHSL